MNPTIQLKHTTPEFLVVLLLTCLAIPWNAQAVSPAPDGGYPGFNTAEGQSALGQASPGVWNTAIGAFALNLDVTGGNANTAIGLNALRHNTTGDNNSALGVNALLFNQTSSNNTAMGFQALKFNTTGESNTAVGVNALVNNITGEWNTAVGQGALAANNGFTNTATGFAALKGNTNGSGNTAVGFEALKFNSTNADGNTAVGFEALALNTTGRFNTANGFDALFFNETGGNNTAIGDGALFVNQAGNANTAIGDSAGASISGSGNVAIGEGVFGVFGANNTTWIRNVYTSIANGRAVYVDADNKIGTLSSSRRFKEEIKPMDKASERLFALKPVTFRYKQDADPTRALSFGLIAEDVAKVDPDLITLDQERKPETVRYEAVNAMLLNEFLKEHRKNEEQQATIARLQKQIEALTAGLQKVSAQVEMNRTAPQMVGNNR
jgi:hypothetical protein